jgi:hypothetical protein
MQIDGWQIDENELQRFDRKWRAQWHARDRLFVCERSDIACLIYSITEVAMNRLAGRLAVYECKTNPALVFNPRKFECRFWDTEDPVEFSHTGKILFVKGGAPARGPAPLSVIDVERRRIAVIRRGELSFAPSVHEITKRTFRLDFSTEEGKVDSALIDLDELEWRDFRKPWRFGWLRLGCA